MKSQVIKELTTVFSEAVSQIMASEQVDRKTAGAIMANRLNEWARNISKGESN